MTLRELRTKRSNGTIRLPEMYASRKRLLVIDRENAVIFARDRYCDDGDAFLALNAEPPAFPIAPVGADIFPESPARYDRGVLRLDQWVDEQESLRIIKELFGRAQPCWWAGIDLTQFYLHYRVFTAQDRYLGFIADIAERLAGDEPSVLFVC